MFIYYVIEAGIVERRQAGQRLPSVERSATPRKGSTDAQGDQRDGLPDATILL